MNSQQITTTRVARKATQTEAQDNHCSETCVGQRIRTIRRENGLSLRTLAQQSGLNINTLSMIENGKSSPCVSTLQQLATALHVPVVSFFETTPAEKRVVYHQACHEPDANPNSHLVNLGGDLAGSAVQPFIVRMEAGSSSGKHPVVHTGHEFVYCLSGEVIYQVQETTYTLHQGDSLVFESHLPHRWHNQNDEETKFLLIFFPSDHRDQPSERHFSNE